MTSPFLKSRRASIGSLGLIVILAIVAISPMMWNGYPKTHSTAFNLGWLVQYQRQFFAGQFYPRWLEFSNFGFGNATFAFYPPLCVVATLPFRALGLGVGGSLVASMALAIALFGGGLYRYTRCFYPAWIALVAAAVGMLSPYLLVNVYERGAIGEVWAIALIPWILFATHQSVRRADAEPSPDAARWRRALARWGLDPDRDWLLLVLVYGLLVLSHLPTLLLFTLVWVVLPGWSATSGRRVAAALRCYAGALLSFGATAFFLVPVLLDGKTVQLDALAPSGAYLPQNRFLLLGLRQLRPRFSERGGLDAMLVQPWLSLLAIALLGAAVWAIWRRWSHNPRPADRAPLSYWAAIAVLALGMTTDLSRKIYLALTTLQRIQFSWRWLSLGAVCRPLLVAAVLHWGVRDRSAPRMLRGGALLLVAAIASWSFVQGASVVGDTEYDTATRDRFIAYSTAQPFPVEPAPERLDSRWIVHYWDDADRVWIEDVREYRAKGVTLELPPTRSYSLLEWQNDALNELDSARLDVVDWSFGRRRILANNPSDRPQSLNLHTFYYPAWSVRQVSSSASWQAVDRASDGRLQVTVPPGQHELQVAYRGTDADRLGRGLSGLTAITLVAIALGSPSVRRVRGRVS